MRRFSWMSLKFNSIGKNFMFVEHIKHKIIDVFLGSSLILYTVISKIIANFAISWSCSASVYKNTQTNFNLLKG